MKILLILISFFQLLFSIDFDYNLKPIKIAENSYYFLGKKEYFSKENGANIANSSFIITKNSVIVIDTGSSYLYGKQLISEIKKLTNKPIKYVINTHHHPDHFLGNAAFKDSSIYASEFTANDIKNNGDSYIVNLTNLCFDWMSKTAIKAPDKYLDTPEIDFDGYKLKILYLNGHTEDDVVIYDENTKILYAADLVFYNRTAATPHADIQKWLNALNKLLKIDYKYIVPGHGRVSNTKEPIRQMIDYLHFIDNRFKESAKKGLNIYEILALDVPKKFADLAMFKEEFERSVINFYPKYESALMK